jgi:O-antigen/teichoic acid export membrane protein
MYDELKRLVKHGSIYTLGMILTKVVSFLMIPLYTNVLKPEQYGTLELLSLSADIVSMIVGFGILAAMMRFYFISDDPKERNRVISTAILGTVAIMAVSAAICISFARPISQLIFHNPENTGNLRITFITMFLASFIEIPLAYLRILQKSVRFVTLSLLHFIFKLGLNILFLVFLHQGVRGVLYGNLIASIMTGSYLILSTTHSTGLRFNKRTYISMLLYGAPLIVSDISAFVLTFSDRFFLNYYTNLTDVGIYSLAYKFGMLISMMLVSPFYQIWGARMFDIYNRPDAKEVISKVLTFFLLAGLGANLALSVLSKDILRLMSNQDYWSAYKLVPVISLSYVINGIIYVISVGILAQGKTKLNAFAMVIAMAANIGLNFLLIPHMGKVGAAYATLATYIIRVALIYYFSQALFRIRYEWGKIFQLAAMSLALIFLSQYITVNGLALSFLFNFMLIILFPILVYFTGIFNPKEKTFIKMCLRNPFKVKELLSAGIS